MGIFKKLVANAGDLLKNDTPERRARKARKKAKSGTADDILTDPSEVERLEKYIAERHKSRIVDKRTGVTFGVEKIGTRGDNLGVLPELLAGASDKAKAFAGSIYAKKLALGNIMQKIKTAAAREVGDRVFVSKNVYARVVSYVRKGKTVSYLRGWNSKTGRIVGARTIKSLVGKGKS